MGLRDYFALVESGAITLMRTDVVKRLGGEVYAVVSAAGLVRAGKPATSWGCDDRSRGCGREIVENAPGEATPFVAVCEGLCAEDACLPLPMTADDLAQETLSLLDLTRALQRLYRLEGAPITTATLARHEPIAIPLGTDRTTDPAGCDVFFVPTPREPAFALFLETRERATRSTRVLVPTARRVLPEMATRYGAGGRVEVEVLEDAIVVRDGGLVRVGKLRLVRPVAEAVTMPLAEMVTAPPAPAPQAKSGGRGIAVEIGATRWEEIKITVIDGHTVRIEHGAVSVRRSYIELGFGGQSRDPNAKWKYVLAVCAGRGGFRWKALGTFDAAKNSISVVRKLLKEAFGLAEDPFRTFTVSEGWRSRFQASSQIADE